MMKNVLERKFSALITTGPNTLPNIYWLKIIIDVLALHHLTSFHPETALLSNIFVVFEILSSEYQLYACG